jgi:hypothetical protein
MVHLASAIVSVTTAPSSATSVAPTGTPPALCRGVQTRTISEAGPNRGRDHGVGVGSRVARIVRECGGAEVARQPRGQHDRTEGENDRRGDQERS